MCFNWFAQGLDQVLAVTATALTQLLKLVTTTPTPTSQLRPTATPLTAAPPAHPCATPTAHLCYPPTTPHAWQPWPPTQPPMGATQAWMHVSISQGMAQCQAALSSASKVHGVPAGSVGPASIVLLLAQAQASGLLLEQRARWPATVSRVAGRWLNRMGKICKLFGTP